MCVSSCLAIIFLRESCDLRKWSSGFPMLPELGSWNVPCRVVCSWTYHTTLRTLPRGLLVGRARGPRHHLKEETHFSNASTPSAVIGSKTTSRRTDNELSAAACYEHGGFLFFGSLWLLGRHGFLWCGSEGDCQVAGVLGGSSRTGQSCGCCVWGDGTTSGAASNLLWSSSGHDVDHRLLITFHTRAQLER